MKVTRLDIEDVLLVELVVHEDERGFFVERFQVERFREQGLPTGFVQDNQSRNAPGVLRGLHYQHTPPQGKLVGVTAGPIWDVAVDVRPDSPTFGQQFSAELSDMNGCLLWIPPGFRAWLLRPRRRAGRCPVQGRRTVRPGGEGGIAWDDPDLAVPWPIADPIVSDRDRTMQSFASYKANPPRWPGAVPAHR